MPVNIRFTGDIELIEILSDIAANDNSFSVTNIEKRTDDSELRMGVGEIADILTLFSTGVLLIQIVAKLFDALKSRRIERFVMTGPTGRVELRYSEQLTHDQVKECVERMLPSNEPT